ncbi:hypothetical protein [Peristeroidobacter agariperforans]|uniref:hypothetical protein n=1 Tax=Peristeroidobacter agariperforans TaxID=268404 RepID=UPI00101DE059|nr:hypothetical protein [Peristeroidobacter agariperforans]
MMEQQMQETNSVERLASNDQRLEFIYKEALRGLVQQQGLVENLNSRSGNLIFAAAFVSSMFGNRALSDGLGIWDWLAIALLFGLGVLIVFMLWPFHRYKFRFDPAELLSTYVDRDAPASLARMHRELALRMEADRADNWRVIQRLRVALQIALILFLLEIAAWLLAIAAAA